MPTLQASQSEVSRLDLGDTGSGSVPDHSAAPLRIVLADDHALFRGGLVLLIKLMDQPAEILEASDLDQATGYLAGGPPIDLLLLDLLMPGMNGIEGVRHICRNWPDVPVVIVSVKEDAKAIREALQAGAMGYIPKTSSPETTTNALKFILAGGVYVPPHILHLSDTRPTLPAERDRGGWQETPGGEKASDALGLTARQVEVLRLMAEGKSNKDIAADLDISPGTVKMHVSRIFKVLKVENRTQAASRLTELTAELAGKDKD